MEDAWGWVDKEKDKLRDFGGVGAPLSASVQPSGEQAPAPMVTGPSAIDQQLTGMALSKGIESTAAGIDAGIKAASVAPSASAAISSAIPTTANVIQGASVAPGINAIGSQTALNTALAGSSIPTIAAAPLASAVPAAAGTSALGAGGSAALTALGPVGLTIGGLLLAKKFGLF